MAVHPLVKRFYPESALLGHTFVDGTLAFYTSINSLLTEDANNMVVLDLGCGRGAFTESDDRYIKNLQNFKGRVKRVIGIDIDPVAASNPTIDEFKLLDPNKPWPLNDNSIDLCVSDWVVEHVDNITFFFSELQRVLKKGAYVCLRTTNKYGYVSVFSNLIPDKFHLKVLKKVQKDRKEVDVFPAVYKCNTRSRINKTMRQNGFEPYVFYHNSEPNYFKFSYISFALGFYFQKLLFESARSTIFAFGRKM